jgi:hypothetical protein
MRIKDNVYARGFRVTADDPTKSYKKDLFKPFDPAIGEEFKQKRSAIQNVIADAATDVAANVGDSKSPVTISEYGSITTPELALVALQKLHSMGLLRDDRSYELNQWRSRPEYAAVMAEARAAGCTHFRSPRAIINITLYIREEEEEFVFSAFPQDILGTIDLLREMPLEVAPVFKIGSNTRKMLTDMQQKIIEVKQISFRNQLAKCEARINRSTLLLDGLALETRIANQFRSNLKTAMAKAVPVLQSLGREHSPWFVRGRAKELDPVIDVIANSGLDVFERRVAPANCRVDTNPTQTQKDLESMADAGLDL